MSAVLYCGDVRSVLAGLPDETVQTVVTSPPYWGLRDYGTASWEGVDAGCDHRPAIKPRSTRPLGAFHGSSDRESASRDPNYREQCGKCGARRVDNQLGLERTPEEYVANMVAVFREVRRVLRDDGTLWLNLGDSYNAGTSKPSAASKHADVGGWTTRSGDAAGARRLNVESLKVKDLVGIPWAVAFALRADGWYLRSEIIWSKPNPMPESVSDRPTKAHEQVFLLSKSERYFYDAAAIAEPCAETTIAQHGGKPAATDVNSRFLNGIQQGGKESSGLNKNGSARDLSGRNARSVWQIATQPYPGAHFATFPEELARRCILAGSAARACESCGAPWERVTEVVGEIARRWSGNDQPTKAQNLRNDNGNTTQKIREHTGWQPSCACEANTGTAQSVVLDPFGGSGTTAAVAVGHGRKAIYIDLNREYLELARDRIGPMLCTDAPEPDPVEVA